MELDSSESERNIEVSHYQNEIDKLEQDINSINDQLAKLASNDTLSPEAQA
jgi:predicted  nucleic acid-binding Zn-ribbon protein